MDGEEVEELGGIGLEVRGIIWRGKIAVVGRREASASFEHSMKERRASDRFLVLQVHHIVVLLASRGGV